ncbi:TPA: glycosyltransferase family 4 protein [Photobacterium damselae]
MRVNIISNSDTAGGAARAAYRLHLALNKNNIESQMVVKHKSSDDYAVISPSKIKQVCSKGIDLVSGKLQKIQKTKNPILHSANFFGSDVFKIIQKSDADIINIHWINGETLSIKQISKINKPVVMTLHDMWAFCGGEHYCSDDVNSRFRLGYSANNKIDLLSGIDLNRFIWNEKMKYWKAKNFTIVTPSRWLSQCAKESMLFKDCNIVTIPNALDMDVFKPIDKKIARELLNLPLEGKLVGFGALGGSKDLRKGFDLLEEALKKLSFKEDYRCVVFGQSTPKKVPNLGVPINYIGHLNDDITLALFYNAIDVMVVPSRQENLPQTATESQACGTPVVAFNTTGFPDAIEHKVTGYLASVFDSNDLASGIKWCIDNDSHNLHLNCRDRAVSLWSQNVISKKYTQLYYSIINSRNV